MMQLQEAQGGYAILFTRTFLKVSDDSPECVPKRSTYADEPGLACRLVEWAIV